MVADGTPLRIEQRSGTIVLIGEIDAYTEAQVREALAQGPDSGDVRVDVSGVTFIDSSGLRVVLGAHQQAIREGRRLVLVAPTKAVTRLIEITGLVSHLHVEPADAPQRVAGSDR